MKHFDATLEEAADRRRTPRLPRGLAIAIAAVLALLLAYYGFRVAGGAAPSTSPAPPASPADPGR